LINTRNKKQLVKEIMQSKKLMVLLALSTRRDLDDKERKKVKKQLWIFAKFLHLLFFVTWRWLAASLS
jgi:hypothetical protein